MGRLLLLGFVFFGFSVTGCETIHTQTAPDDAYNIRKPANTTRAVRQEDTVIIERVY